MVSDGAAAPSPFAARTVVVVIALAALAFVAFLLLLAFGGDVRRGHDARAHALSVSGDGYAALVALTEGVGYAPLLVRDQAAMTTPGLLIATPPPGGDGAALAALVTQRQGRPTLIVLPKWATRPERGNHAWAEVTGTYPPSAVLAPLAKLAAGVRLAGPALAPDRAPVQLTVRQIGARTEQQRLAARGLEPLLVDAEGRIVLARLPGTAIYLLAEPDLVNNAGLADRRVATAAMTIVDRLAPNNEIAFDLTLNGLGATHGTLRLLFEPPFLPATLCLTLAALLAGFHGAVRFGAPKPPVRAVAFGKAALLDNMALLIRGAGKEPQLGEAYAAMALAEATRAAGLPTRLNPEAHTQELDRARAGRGLAPLSELTATAVAARNRAELLVAARALHRWMRNGTP